MSHHDTPKKSAGQQDWHRADIVAALRKSGWTLRRLATHHGYKSPTTLKHALDRPWPKGERLIAAAIGIPPESIWPERYRARATRDCDKDSCSVEHDEAGAA
ncbi:MAG: transcriptional regulator [Thiohalospira sp.]